MCPIVISVSETNENKVTKDRDHYNSTYMYFTTVAPHDTTTVTVLPSCYGYFTNLPVTATLQKTGELSWNGVFC